MNNPASSSIQKKERKGKPHFFRYSPHPKHIQTILCSKYQIIILFAYSLIFNLARLLPYAKIAEQSTMAVLKNNASENQKTFNGPMAQLVSVPPCHGGGCGFESRLDRHLCRCSSMVEHDLAMVDTGVRFSSSAPFENSRTSDRPFFCILFLLSPLFSLSPLLFIPYFLLTVLLQFLTLSILALNLACKSCHCRPLFAFPHPYLAFFSKSCIFCLRTFTFPFPSTKKRPANRSEVSKYGMCRVLESLFLVSGILGWETNLT